MCCRVDWIDMFQATYSTFEGIVEIFDHNLVVPRIDHQIFFGGLCYSLDFFKQAPIFRLIDAVLKQLEEECSVEAATVATHSPHTLVARV